MANAFGFGFNSPFGTEYDNNFFEDEKKPQNGFGVSSLSPIGDVVISKKGSTSKPSHSPVGDRYLTPPDSYRSNSLSSPIGSIGNGFGSLSSIWEPTNPTLTSPNAPQHMNNLFGGFSISNPLIQLSPKSNHEESFMFKNFSREIDEIQNVSQNHYQKPKSPSLEVTPPSMDDDMFGMDPDDMNGDNYANRDDSIPSSPGNGEGYPPGFNPSADSFTASFGEHPLGEHPSRTLFVRNINSNVEDEELSTLFEQYGPIRNMYTQCKHRGFVMISYYDIRHAKNAMRYSQGKVLRRRKLDIHYSIPKDNPSEKDQNQGTLVVFNLDPATMNEELKGIFGSFGEIKEIRETPNKKHHKFIEFYDIRDAERAMKSLNKTEIKGKKIKIEPSRPGGARKNDDQLGQPQSLPFISGNEMGREENLDYSPSTNSYPPPQQQLPKYVPTPIGHSVSPPTISIPATYRAPSRPRSRSVTTFQPNNPVTSSPPSIMSFQPVARSSSSSSLPSMWELPINVSPRSFSPSPADSKNKGLGMSPPSNNNYIGLNGFEPIPSVINREKSSPDSETRRHRSYSTEEDKTKFVLSIERVRGGYDIRTTLMIKNIPNKYSQKMLLAAVDERHRGTYDFFYLPIDFRNKCNVGYAFINFTGYEFIISFYEEFNHKKWEKFNSEKVCEITFARIQGKINLVNHFQNSSLMCEDKKCRPIIFNSGEQEPFPLGLSPRRNRSYSNSSKEDDPR